MCVFQLLFSLDSSLGKVSYRLLSDQTLMEMLIEGFDDKIKKHYQDSEGTYLNVCKCSGIACDSDERVIKINVDSENSSGSLELGCVPPNVKVLGINSWGKSELTGSVDLTHLPDVMESLCVSGNQLTGEIDLTRLPGEMESVYLDNNHFTGEIDLAHLPHEMEYLYLSRNRLSGSLFIWNLPPRMSFIDMRFNHFNAIAVVNPEIHATINLKGSGVTSFVYMNGGEIVTKCFLS